jgi:hypothetical protein
MATVPSRHPARVTAEQTQRIYSPLHKLRGIIRRYITWDSLALAVILLAAWFWAGLVLDYGVFKLTGVDWVQVLPWWMRLVMLLVIAGAIAAAIALALRRLLRELSPESLALVLERRFPKLLRDQLITAVELSDLDKAEEYGYSRQMILETVRDVSSRVDQVPVRSVFNWARLRRRWMWAALLSAGLLLVKVAVYLGVHRNYDVVDFGYRFTDVSAIWAERNLLLQNTLWPRRAYLEILDFPESGELRIGRDAPSPRIRVRALKWVIADRRAPDGWRALTWADLNSDLLMGRAVPTLPVALLVPPAEAQNVAPADDPSWTLDRVELLLDQDETRNRVTASGDFSNLRDVFDSLDRKAALASMSRKLRKLEVPKEVKIYYWGARTSDEAPLVRQQQGVNEYAVVITDLKESVKFYVKGEDYSTYPYRRITLVPPPMLTKLEKDEYLPAYQYYRPPADGSALDLKGKKQQRLGGGVSLTGGTSRVEIASGSDLVLRGELDKELTSARLRYRSAAKGVAGAVEELKLSEGNRNIQVGFKNVTQPIEFDFEFTDTDNVKSLRHVVIQPVEDKKPDVNVVVETIRKVGGNYMCTPYAKIPFNGTVRDDVGLSRVEYAVSYSRVETPQVAALRAVIAAGILQSAVTPSPSPRELYGLAGVVDYVGRLAESRESATTMPPFPLRTFTEQVEDKDKEHRYGKDALAELLARQYPNLDDLRRQRQITGFEIKPANEDLDLQDRIPDLSRDLDATIRPRYRMRVTIQAVDNNIETGPRTGQNNETFTFLVVPHEELLAEINKDEETLGYKSQELADRMYDIRNGLEKVVERMPRLAGGEEFRSSASRLDEILGELEKGSDNARELLTECQRLLKEGQANRLPANFIESKELITNLLDEALRVHFEKARDAHTQFRDALQTRRPPEPAIVEASRQRQEELIRQIDRVKDLLISVLGITKVAKNLQDVIENRLILQTLVKMVKQDAEDKIEMSLAEIKPKADAVELRTGEKKVVTIDLGRDDFARGRMMVKISPPMASEIAATSPLTIGRLVKNAQVEITAGTKTGTFAVPVTISLPDGTPIRHKDNKTLTLQVTVK